MRPSEAETTAPVRPRDKIESKHKFQRWWEESEEEGGENGEEEGSEGGEEESEDIEQNWMRGERKIIEEI